MKVGMLRWRCRNLRHCTTAAAGQIGMDYAGIVDADVRELRAACDLADRPDTGRGGLQPLVDLDVSGEVNTGQFQTESFGIRLAACGDPYMATLENFLNSTLLDDDTHRVGNFVRHLLDPCIVMPNSLLRRKYDATFALWMMFLLLSVVP
jgi:hypothetical protein